MFICIGIHGHSIMYPIILTDFIVYNTCQIINYAFCQSGMCAFVCCIVNIKNN